MQAEERHKRIAQYLAKAEFASLDELAFHVSASPSTVRRDLNFLERGGSIRRTHGGACLVNPAPDMAATLPETPQLPEKEAIARLCAGLISPGQSVFIDAGTTALAVARELEGKSLHIVTNSLPVANHFAANQNVEVIVSGGVIYPRLGVLVGPVAVEVFSKMHADVAIMSGGGVTEDGITNSHALLIDMQRAMIQGAGRVIFCFDHTKIGRRSVAFLCDLASIDTVITDAAAPREMVDALRQTGLEVLIAGETDEASGVSLPPESEAIETEAAAAPSKPSVTGSSELSGGMSWD